MAARIGRSGDGGWSTAIGMMPHHSSLLSPCSNSGFNPFVELLTTHKGMKDALLLILVVFEGEFQLSNG